MLILIVLIYFGRHVLALLFLAIVISSALDAPLNYLEKRRIPRIVGLIFIAVAGVSIVVLLFYTILPLAVFEIKHIADNFSKVAASFGTFFGISTFFQNINLSLNDIASEIITGDISFPTLLSTIFENILMIITVIVISFYLALYRDGVEGFLKAVLPYEYEKYVVDLFYRTRKRIAKWLEGQIILSLIIAITTFIGLKALGVNYALVLSVLTAVLEIIPFVGPVIAGLIAILIAVSQSTTLAVYVLILFVVIHQLESHLLVPVIMRKTTGIHPVIVAISILAGWQIYGIIGVILAIPTVVLLEELIDDYAKVKSRQQRL